MPPVRSRPHIEELSPLLVYLHDYGVVICRSCEFAIQPNAVSSHLLRHQVYRDKRRVLLECLEALNLLDPEEVPCPSPKSKPFPHLSVAAGYRCTLPGCDHLCISQKRMSQHLREHHGRSRNRDLERCSQQAHMQTFFKGNKVRYFEVQLDPGTLLKPAATEQLERMDRYHFLTAPFVQNVDSTPRRATNDGEEVIQRASITQDQMQDLMYLHHYTTSTALSMNRGTEPDQFWTHDIPLEATSQSFLMHGILGVAAFHRASMAPDFEERKKHHVAGLRHQSVGLDTFRGIIDHPTVQNSTALTAFSRILGVQFCAEALLDADTHSSHSEHHTDPILSKVLNFMLLLKGGLDLLLNLQSLLPSISSLVLSAETLQGLGELEMAPEALDGVGPYLVNEVCMKVELLRNSSPSTLGSPYRSNNLTELRQLIDFCLCAPESTESQRTRTGMRNSRTSSMRQMVEDGGLFSLALAASRCPAETSFQDSQSGHPTPWPVLLCYPHIPPAIYAHLASISSRLHAIIPQQVLQNLTAFNQAMAALVSSFSRFYMSDSTWARWNGIESWPRMLSEDFLVILEGANPAALVLVAHWCVLLSKHEDSYWFLHGQSQRMLTVVLANLDDELQLLVQDGILVCS